MNQDNKLEYMDSLPVMSSIIHSSVPAMIAMLMALVYNLADSFFVGQTHNLYQITAVALATPVFLFLTAVGTIFGVGGASLIARALGAHEHTKVRGISSFCFWTSLGVGLGLTIILDGGVNVLLHLLGASGQVGDFTRQYLLILLGGSIPTILATCLASLVRSEGQARAAMVGQVVGNVFNVVLDYLFIVCFHWGVIGAAAATVIGNVIATGYYLWFIFYRSATLSLRLRDYLWREHVAYGVLSIGIPAALASILMSVAQIILNYQMSDYGEAAVAGSGIATRILMITSMISLGVSQGVQPLLGFSFGRGDHLRFYHLLRASLIFTFLLNTSLTIFCYLFTLPIVKLFLSDPQAIECAVSFARIVLLTAPLYALTNMITTALQAKGEARPALLINISSNGLFYLPSLFILGHLYGATGLVAAQCSANICTLLLAYILYRRTSHESIVSDSIVS